MKLLSHLLLPLTAMLLLVNIGCSDRNPTQSEVARARIDPLVFDDDYGDDVYFQAFSDTDIHAVSVDSIYTYGGIDIYDDSRSLKIAVPPENYPRGIYAGGVLTSTAPRDLTDFNALTFWARSSEDDVLLDVAGFGNDNSGNSLYDASINFRLSREWRYVVIPLPSPARLISERGLLTFADGWYQEPWDGPSYPQGVDIWFDDIKYIYSDSIIDPRPVLTSVTEELFVGAAMDLNTATVFALTFDADTTDVTVSHNSNYFEYQSSDSTVAIADNGIVHMVGIGEAVITASLDGIEASGEAQVTGLLPPPGPAPIPQHPASDVISMFSDTYDDHPVDTWNPYWGGTTTQLAEYSIDGNNTKLYSSLNWVGIMFTEVTVDASEMTHLHVDLFAPSGGTFGIKLVALNGPGGAVETEVLLNFNADSFPAFVPGEWSSLDILLDDYVYKPSWDEPFIPIPREFIGMIVLVSTDTPLVLVDNLYWYKETPGATSP